MSTVFPVGEFIRDEMKCRAWTRTDLVAKMSRSPDDVKLLRLELDILLDAPTKGVMLSESTAIDLGRAFGTSASLWRNLDRQWQESDQAK